MDILKTKTNLRKTYDAMILSNRKGENRPFHIFPTSQSGIDDSFAKDPIWCSDPQYIKLVFFVFPLSCNINCLFFLPFQ